jgi:ABC-type sugar transport system substrate-binding protein
MVAAVAAALALAGGVAALAQGASGSLPKSGTVVFFGLSQQNPYVAQWHVGAQLEAKKLGWKLNYVEDQNSQSQQDSQISQVLGGGTKPIGVILSPFEASAAAASMLAIKKAGIPLMVIDAPPPASQNALYDAFVGDSDPVSGSNAAKMLVAKAKADGVKLGGGLVVTCPLAYTSCGVRPNAFKAELHKLAPGAKVIKMVESAPTTTAFGAPGAYSVASQVVPQIKGKFNFLYASNDALALGAIKALKENGLTPGKNVLAVGATCLGKTTDQAVIDGELVGTDVQSPLVEGELSVIAIAQYINSGGKVLPGSEVVGSAAAPSLSAPLHKITYMPTPIVNNSKAAFLNTKIWGQTAQQLCSYTS